MAEGWHVSGTTRTHEKQQELIAKGMDVHIFDGTTAMDQAGVDALQKSTHIISTIDPDYRTGKDCVLIHHIDDINQSERFVVGYLSSIAVYGNRPDELLNQNSEPNPKTPRSIGRHQIEQQWQQIKNSTLFRCGGIYGPDRIPFDDFLEPATQQNPETIISDWIICTMNDQPNRKVHHIHIDDLSGAVATAFNNDKVIPIINLVDTAPVTTSNLMMHVARIAGIDDYLDKNNSTIKNMGIKNQFIKSFFSTYAEFDNSQIGNELGYRMKYPSVLEGTNMLIAQKVVKNRNFQTLTLPTPQRSPTPR